MTNLLQRLIYGKIKVLLIVFKAERLFMNEDWNDIPKIKVDTSDFAENFSNQSFYKDSKNERNSDDDYKNSYISVDMERPDEIKVKNIILLLSIVCLIVVIPIMYHNIKNYLEFKNSFRPREALEVTLKHPERQLIYDKTESTGLITPVSAVDVIARADGYLEHTYIKEGDFVKKGQLLFSIEPNEYQIAVRAEEASVASAMAVYKNSMQELERGKELIKENFISRSDYDAMVASADSSKASLDMARQSLARAKMSLGYTKITAPISGKAGKINITDGNYVSMGSGALVKILNTTPIAVVFSLKSSDIIKMKKGNNGILDLSQSKVELLLSDDSLYDKVGKITFSDNEVSDGGASITVKAVFDNPDNILVPGDYVRIIITAPNPRDRILIPLQLAHGDALNGYYVWTVSNGVTRKKRIVVEGTTNNNEWIVESGLSENDEIVVKSNIPIDMEFMPAKVQDKTKKDKPEESSEK